MNRLLSLLILAVAFAGGMQARKADIKSIVKLSTAAIESVDRRLAEPTDTTIYISPQTDIRAAVDSIEAYLDRGWDIDAFVTAKRLYALCQKHNIKLDQRSNLTYLRALAEHKGYGQYEKYFYSKVQKADTLDSALCYDANMALLLAEMENDRLAAAYATAEKLLKYCTSKNQAIDQNLAYGGVLLSDNQMGLATQVTSFLPEYIEPGSEQEVTYLNLLANIENKFGHKERELAYRRQCAQLSDKIYSDKPARRLYYYNTAFNTCQRAGLDDEALDWINRMRPLMEELSGHTGMYTLVFNIGTYLTERGDNVVETLLLPSFNQRSRIHSSRDITRAELAAVLAHQYYTSGETEKALLYQKGAIATRGLLCQRATPAMIRELANGAAYAYECGDKKTCAEYMRQMVNAYRECIPEMFVTLSARERADILDTDVFTGAIGNQAPQMALSGLLGARGIYDATTMYRGILLATEQDMKDRIAHSGDSTLIADYAEYVALKKELDRLRPEDKAKTDELSYKMEQLERSIMKRSHEAVSWVSPLRIMSNSIQHELKKGEVAVEFIQARFSDGQNVYGMLCLRPGLGNPDIVPLFNDSMLDSIAPDTYYTSPDLYNIMWKWMADNVPKLKTIYFAPSQRFQNVAIEYLPDSTGTPLNQRFNVHRLSSTREIAIKRDWRRQQIKGDADNSNSAAIFGGINYYPDEADLIAALDDGGNAMRSAIDKSRLGGSLAFLPGTVTETVAINNMFTDRGMPTTLLTGAAGTERAVKALDGHAPSILHIATHGFYQPDNGDGGGEAEALTRSGLMMAGAGVDMSALGDDNLDDGILTAAEISRLDLDGLDLVVLSACESGLGDVGADGVFGLQRGFKKAGAQSILMALDKVDDRATYIFMISFYRHLLDGASKTEAMNRARAELIAADGGAYAHPRFWTPFVIIDAL